MPLTSVRQPMWEMGDEAAGMLVRCLVGESGDSRMLPPELHARASTFDLSR